LGAVTRRFTSTPLDLHVTGLSPDECCAVCGSVLVPPELASGLRIPSTADYVCLKCGRAYRWKGNPRRLSLLVAVDKKKTVPSLSDLPRKAPRILIVDDDENTLDTYARMLRLEHFEVYTALDADSGLRVLDASPVDAMVVDLVMPEASGLDFLRQVRARDDCYNTPVALVTGNYFVDDEVEDELRALGAKVRYKPLWLEDLTKLVHKLLSGV
jgi:CheY-like chemotaxis protein